MRIFMKIKSSRNGQIILSLTGEGKSCHNRDFYVSNTSVNAICENKIFLKISEFTVFADKHTLSLKMSF